MTRRAAVWIAAPLGLLALLAALVLWLNLRGEAPLDTQPTATTATPELIERGAYLARAGNCIGCHSVPGGTPFAGGRGIDTPFGTVYAPNLTPAPETGLGRWSAAEFWRALHHGRSKDGRLLYPAFPYPSFTQVTREDSDALYAYLRTLPAVEQARPAHALRFPYSTQAALAVWRALYFRPGAFVPDTDQSPEWNRGRYLVQGLGHCAACHSGRNLMGAISLNTEFAGGLMPDASWYAPSLASPQEAGVQGWSRDEVVALLKGGSTARASVSGPMAEVVASSLQHLGARDLEAMALYLATIPERPIDSDAEPKRANPDVMARGAKLYEQHCASCHGEQGQGAPGIYPPLAGNRALTLAAPNNLVQLIRHGGFAPSTAANPRPFGMPPFAHLLSNEDIAALATFLRKSWGHDAAPVTPLEVLRVE